MVTCTLFSFVPTLYLLCRKRIRAIRGMRAIRKGEHPIKIGVAFTSLYLFSSLGFTQKGEHNYAEQVQTRSRFTRMYLAKPCLFLNKLIPVP